MNRISSLLVVYCFLTVLGLFNYHVALARNCYECSSTFPENQICLPDCTSSFIPNSTCLLVRNVPLEADQLGTLRAAHIFEYPAIGNIQEKDFLYGSEQVYLHPSVELGWLWNYGPITYGCDTDNCNDPKIINYLPNLLNARIPNETLDRWLTGNIDTKCYTCSGCVDDGSSLETLLNCVSAPCANRACAFTASRYSSIDIQSCGNQWRFSSECSDSREEAQVTMDVMYYTRSQRHEVYRMEAVCLADNCNNLTTFKALQNAVRVEPDLTCFSNITYETTSRTTNTPSTSRTTTRTTPSTSTSTSPLTGSTSSSSSFSSVTSTERVTTTTTTLTSSAMVISSELFSMLLVHSLLLFNNIF